MESITLSAEQTNEWEDQGSEFRQSLRRELIRRCLVVGRMLEIYACEGYLLDVVDGTIAEVLQEAGL